MMRSRSWIVWAAGLAIGIAAGNAWAQSGYALEFDGVDDRLVVSDPVNLTGPLTLEAWIRPDAFDGGRIISNRTATDGYELDIDDDGYLRFTTNAYVKADTDISAYLGQWLHVAVTWEGSVGGGIVMYVNGEAVATNSSTNEVVPAAGSLTIGRAAWDYYTFNGAIDEPRIFDTVVDGGVIRTWMNRRIDPGHPDFAHLRGAWCFEEAAGQIAACAGGGPDGRLGASTAVDGADPAWIASGMVAAERRSWSGIKRIYRP